MMFRALGQDEFVFYFKDRLIDVFDRDELQDLVKVILKRMLKVKKQTGVFLVEVFINYEYGTIVEVTKKKGWEVGIDVKLKVHLGSNLLQEIDDFEFSKENNDKIIYYYNGNFYTEYRNTLVLDSKIEYGDRANQIISEGIKLFSLQEEEFCYNTNN